MINTKLQIRNDKYKSVRYTYGIDKYKSESETWMSLVFNSMTMTMTFNLVRLMKIARTTASFVSVIPSVASHASGQRRYIDDDGHDDDPFWQ